MAGQGQSFREDSAGKGALLVGRCLCISLVVGIERAGGRSWQLASAWTVPQLLSFDNPIARLFSPNHELAAIVGIILADRSGDPWLLNPIIAERTSTLLRSADASKEWGRHSSRSDDGIFRIRRFPFRLLNVSGTHRAPVMDSGYSEVLMFSITLW